MRLSYLQLFSKKYILNAFNISIKQEITIPERGYIFDKNGNLLVYNKPIYDLNVTPFEIEKNFKIKEFCKLVDVDDFFFKKKIENAKYYSKYLPSTFLSYISEQKFALIQEKLHHYKGFYPIKRSLRGYNIKSMSNILGYISEVENKEIKQDPSYYQIGDFIGRAGVEKSCEKILRGKKGINYWIKDKKGKIISSYKNKKYDIKAIRGNDITLTIDLELQNYAEKLMYKKKGSIVAIDPKNGEIIVLISSPIIDPNLFIYNDRYKKIKELMEDKINNPLFDRSTQGLYPPGSPFKVLTELAGLQMGVVNEKTTFICKHGFHYGNKKIKCHCGIYNKPINLDTAIALSCNNYFAQVYKKIIEKYPKNSKKGINEWSKIIKSFGLGEYLNNDLSSGYKGRIPSSDYYNKKYPKGWKSTTIISNSIGQGEIDVTPIQLANMTAAIANKGFFYIPHIIKKINFKSKYNIKKIKPKKTEIKSIYFEPIIKGMEKVFIIGTGKNFRSENINMAGKTGTAQNFIKKKNKIIPLEDHSIFTLFAPVKNPKIVIAVLIENAGFGSKWAGPIASLIAEKHILKKTTRKKLEERMMCNGLEKKYKKITNLKKSTY